MVQQRFGLGVVPVLPPVVAESDQNGDHRRPEAA
jgi:hypothetical protein